MARIVWDFEPGIATTPDKVDFVVVNIIIFDFYYFDAFYTQYNIRARNFSHHKKKNKKSVTFFYFFCHILHRNV